MTTRQISVFILLPVLLMATARAVAGVEGPQPVRLAPIMDRQREIADLVDFYREGLDARQKALIKHAQLQIRWVVDGHATLEELTPNDRLRLKNALATVDAVIDGSSEADERRQVCKRERGVGSQIKAARCVTVGNSRIELERQLKDLGME